MKHQRILWVILSIVFVAIVALVGGLWLLKDNTIRPEGDSYNAFTPLSRMNDGAASYYDAFEYTKNNIPLSGLVEQKDELSEETQAEDSTSEFMTQELAAGDKKDERSKSSPRFEEYKHEPAYSEPAKSKSEILKYRKEKAPPTSKREKPVAYTQKQKIEPRAKTVYIKEYWIQTGSYRNRNSAEILNSQLKENGLSGRIIAHNVRGDTYFRVRIGPYSDQEEAKKFLAWVKDIKECEGSYVSEVTVKQRVYN